MTKSGIISTLNLRIIPMYVPLVAKGLIFLSFTLIANSDELVLDDENFVDMGGKDIMIGGLDSFDEIVLGI